MLTVLYLEKISRKIFLIIENWFNKVFGGKNNPLYNLGALAFYFYYIVIATGIYLFIFYDPNVTGSYDAIEYLSHTQWYAGGLMRSLHRYASDGMIVCVIFHIFREFSLGRYTNARWFTWVTGVPPLLLLFPSGLIGYWLVWDKLAQYIAVRTTEWFDWLPIISEPSAGNFLTNTSVSDLFFRLILIVHIVIPIFMFVGLLVHIKRINKSQSIPPRSLAIGTLLSLIVLSFAVPAMSHQRADLSVVPGILHLDWFYMFLYPLMDYWSMSAVWALVTIMTLLLTILPWLSKHNVEPVAKVYLDKCSGCNLCVVECPYEAIRLHPRSDKHPHYIREAYVIDQYCVSCGICTGSCPSLRLKHITEVINTGIDLPHKNVEKLHHSIQTAIDNNHSDLKILVFGCDHAVDTQNIPTSGIIGLRLPCTGALPPALLKFALKIGANGIILTGCPIGDCYNRLGNQWIEHRLGFTSRAKKHTNRWLSEHRIEIHWVAKGDENTLYTAIEQFKLKLQS